MTLPPTDLVLAQVDAYLDAAPRTAAKPVDIGAFTLFVGTGPWSYYARPRLGLDRPVTAEDVAAVRAKQRELAVPEAFEWVAERAPSLAPVARAAGLRVVEHPLLVLDPDVDVPEPAVDGAVVRILDADAEEADVAALRAVASVGFGHPGTATGEAGPQERDARQAAQDQADVDFTRSRLQAGHSRLGVAETRDGIVAVGVLQPVGDSAEIVGVATLPAARRQGLGAAVTAALAREGRRLGCRLVLLSAGDEDVARVYQRVGFVRVGVACEAEPAGSAD